MSGNTSAETNWPVKAYFEPIRSVLFIDDQFPTFEEVETEERRESTRARGLWRACRKQGWLCDIDNKSDWSSEDEMKRLASCDLLVLDFHLNDGDPTPALQLIDLLAQSENPNLVIVYTAETNLDNVLLQLGASACGAVKGLLDTHLDDDVAQLDGKLEASTVEILAHIRGEKEWVDRVARELALPSAEQASALVERTMRQRYQAPVVTTRRTVEKISANGDSRWLQCGNLFVTLVGKPQAREAPGEIDCNSLEADRLIACLKRSITEWNPPELACLVALSRNESNRGAFRDDLATIHGESLRGGLLQYIRDGDAGEERERRSRVVARDLLDRRFERSISPVSEALLSSSTTSSNPPSQDGILRANAFLCSSTHDRNHLRVGSIFRTQDGDYFVCVTPACDMVPREPKQERDPWGASLENNRAFTAVRLELKAEPASIKKALKDCLRGRYIFFEEEGNVLAAAVFATTADEPNPKLEQMFAADLARKQPNMMVSVLRIRGGKSGEAPLVVYVQECTLVAQLRAPYAERLTHIVGGHLSRIGVDFLKHL